MPSRTWRHYHRSRSSWSFWRKRSVSGTAATTCGLWTVRLRLRNRHDAACSWQCHMCGPPKRTSQPLSSPTSLEPVQEIRSTSRRRSSPLRVPVSCVFVVCAWTFFHRIRIRFLLRLVFRSVLAVPSPAFVSVSTTVVSRFVERFIWNVAISGRCGVFGFGTISRNRTRNPGQVCCTDGYGLVLGAPFSLLFVLAALLPPRFVLYLNVYIYLALFLVIFDKSRRF